MSQSTPRACPNCGASIPATSRFCRNCGALVASDSTHDAIMIHSGKRLRVAHDTLSLRDVQALVESGVFWWQQQLNSTEGINRERAAAAIKDLSRILDSLAQQLAQGRETVRITTRLPVLRDYSVGCPVCGRGNRAGARFCLSCGSRLPDPNNKGAIPAALRSLQINAAWRSDTGQLRPNNEDTCYVGTITTAGAVAATVLLVADGMGGARAGHEASRLASETIQRELLAQLQQIYPDTDEAWHTLLQKAARAANQRVYTQAQATMTKQGMGTTLTMVVVAGNRAHMAHVGDSRAYLINANGITVDGSPIMQLSSDHTLVARLVDIGQLTPEQARTHSHRNMLYRSLGTDPVIEIDISSQPLTIGDMLVLCSDGLTTYVEDAELARMALAAPDPEQVCQHLITLANRRGGNDNISVIVAKIEGS